MVDAVITSDKVFKIPKQKVGKFVVGNSDMTNNFNQKNSTQPSTVEEFAAKIAKLIANSNNNFGLNAESSLNPTTNSAQTALKRKATDDKPASSPDEKSDEEDIRSKLI